jgi:cytochrome c peroxidase
VTTISQREAVQPDACEGQIRLAPVDSNNDPARTMCVCLIQSSSSIPGAQEPGETVEIAFPATGSFLVFCGIHPKMELYVDVTK